MVRTQIQMEPSEHAMVKSFAQRRGISMSAAIRLLVRRGLGEADSPDRAAWEALLAFEGAGHEPDGATDVASRHDFYLYGQ